MAELTDQSPMPWGKFKGQTMQSVPANYLLNMYELGKVCPDVRAYIQDNMDVLQVEIKREIKPIEHENTINRWR